ncbi:MAG: hypothetical protein WCL14_12760 [Bacteroidota bacterium]
MTVEEMKQEISRQKINHHDKVEIRNKIGERLSGLIILEGYSLWIGGVYFIRNNFPNEQYISLDQIIQIIKK